MDIAAATFGYFLENKGQVSSEVRYYSQGEPSVGFRDDGVLFIVRETPQRTTDDDLAKWPLASPAERTSPARSLAYLVRLDGGGRVTPIGTDEASFRSNFLLGNDPSAWHTGVRSYGSVVYHNLYDGISLAYHADTRGTKYEFILRPEADPNRIAIVYEGVDSLAIEDGDLVVRTALGIVRDSAPVAYQGTNMVACSFVLLGPRSAGFQCTDRDPSRPLVIDPLVYSTFLGTGGYDGCIALDVNSAGNAYVTGLVGAAGFPVTPGAFDETYPGGEEAFVIELDASGNIPVFATYLGGTGNDRGYAIALDSDGNAYVTGRSDSADFPVTTGAFDTSYGGGNVYGDAFVVKLSAAGSALEYATYLGGGSDDTGSGIAIDVAGNAYVTGHTYSPDFPATQGAFQLSMRGTTDAFVAKLDPAGVALVYSTFLGGSGSAGGWDVKVDVARNAYIFGGTGWGDFPVTVGAFDTVFDGGSDAFVTKLNPNGSALVYSTFLGGSAWELPGPMRLDAYGNAYLGGETVSPDFPVTPGAYSIMYHAGGRSDGDGYVAKLDPTGTSLAYSTFLGGSEWDAVFGLALDSAGNAHLSGTTFSADFPTTRDALDVTLNNQDGFIAELDFRGSTLRFSTFLGGSDTEATVGIQVDASRNVYTAGWTYSHDFPVTPLALDQSQNGPPDGFVAKLGARAEPNTPPQLFWTGAPRYASDGLDPETGLRGTTFDFRVAYSDANNDPPTRIEVHIEKPAGTPWATLEMDIESWRGKPGDFSVGANYTASTILPAVGVDYWYHFSAADRADRGEGSPTLPVDAPDVVADDPPVAVASAAPTVGHMGEPVRFDGSGSQDDVGIVSYLWRFGDGASDPTPVATHVYTARGTFIATLEVWDVENQSDIESVTVDIQNRPPIASAGADLVAFVSVPTTIDGSSSLDPDGDALRFSWSQTGGPQVGLVNPEAAALRFVPLEAGTYLFRLRVDDGHGGVSEDEVVVMVSASPPPPVNLKPLVAMAFAIALSAVGAWSAKRAPWRRGAATRARLVAFVVFGLPFVIAEVVTGVVSLLTGLLSIPPIVGIGTSVDTGILLAGLAVSAHRFRNRNL